MITDGASPSTVANVIRTLSAALGGAVGAGLIPRNPLTGNPKGLRR